MLRQCNVLIMSAMQYQSNVHGAMFTAQSHLWWNFVLGRQLPSTVQCLAHWQSGHCV